MDKWVGIGTYVVSYYLHASSKYYQIKPLAYLQGTRINKDAKEGEEEEMRNDITKLRSSYYR